MGGQNPPQGLHPTR